MGRLLEVAEKNDFEGREGEFLPYSIRPFKLTVREEVPRWDHRPGDLCRVKISLDKWTVDEQIYKRYESLFAEKYPVAWGKFSAQFKEL
jgi:hypothetical protein